MSIIREAYDLVKSLEHNELRYVSWYLKLRNTDTEKNDVVLFSILADISVFDELTIDQQLSKHPSLKKFTASSVSRLIKAVLKALRAFREENSIELKLRNMLEDDSILKERLINGTREKLLNKLYNKSYKYELYDVLLEVLDRQILMYLSSKSDDALIHEKLAVLDTIRKERDYFAKLQLLYYKYFTIYRMGIPLSQEQMEQYEAAFTVLQEEYRNFDKAFFIGNLYLSAACMLQLLIGNKAMVYQLRHEQVQWWDANPHMIEYRLINYKMVLANYLVASFEIGNFHSFPGTLKKLRELPVLSLDDEGEVFQNVAFLELLLYMNQSRFKEALALVPGIETGLQKYAHKVNDARRMAFAYNIMILYFELADYEHCIEWIQKVRLFKTAHRSDIQARVFMIELAAHSSLSNTLILESLLRNTRRRFQKENRFSDFEAGLFKRFRALVLAQPDQRTKNLDNLHAFLEEYHSDVKGEVSYCREELLRWTARLKSTKGKPR